MGDWARASVGRSARRMVKRMRKSVVYAPVGDQKSAYRCQPKQVAENETSRSDGGIAVKRQSMKIKTFFGGWRATSYEAEGDTVFSI